MSRSGRIYAFALCLFVFSLVTFLFKAINTFDTSSFNVEVDSKDHEANDDILRLIALAISSNKAKEAKEILKGENTNETDLGTKLMGEGWEDLVIKTANLSTTLELCPTRSAHSVGEHKVDASVISVKDVEKLLPEVQNGGAWHPEHCTARHRVAILIPYRNREQHLGVFLRHMHPFLQRQLLDYRIFLVEQSEKSQFNRGMLFNIGFKHVEEMTSGYYQCYVLSDVDILPENDLGQYSCTYDLPRHLAFYMNKWNYEATYAAYMGGVLELCKDHYTKANGFSNVYFGWGAEDDDFAARLNTLFPNSRPYQRYNSTLGRAFMLGHKAAEHNHQRQKYFNKYSTKRMPIDGLTTVDNTYKLLKIEELKLYTRIYAEIDQEETMAQYHKRAKIHFGETDRSLRNM